MAMITTLSGQITSRFSFGTMQWGLQADAREAVSYTHLTLPTIVRV